MNLPASPIDLGRLIQFLWDTLQACKEDDHRPTTLPHRLMMMSAGIAQS